MPGTTMVNPDYTFDLVKMVRSSLETLRNTLRAGTQTEDTGPQIEQLEQLEQLLIDQAARLGAINRVLEEFNYSVAHELFAPLRRISGFAREIKQRCAFAMDAQGVTYLDSILESSQLMNELIDALMQLSRLSHVELHHTTVDLSEMANHIADELILSAPKRAAVFSIAPQVCATGDASLLRILLRKLLENAWKYTVLKETALIEFGTCEVDGSQAFYVRDNGIGFDMAEYGRLFHPFQHLHDRALFSGNGIGLTAVKRIIDRHNGRIWAEGADRQGTTFYFTL